IAHNIKSAGSTIALEQVRSYGMKGRQGNLAEKILLHNNMKGQHVYKAENCAEGIEHGPEVEEENVLRIYDKTKSLFDNILCETKERLEQELND
ncbi:998_t:CDS:2, partial [Dentiscutata erythropus]